jgi:hypothetical protein
VRGTGARPTCQGAAKGTKVGRLSRTWRRLIFGLVLRSIALLAFAFAFAFDSIQFNPIQSVLILDVMYGGGEAWMRRGGCFWRRARGARIVVV